MKDSKGGDARTPSKRRTHPYTGHLEDMDILSSNGSDKIIGIQPGKKVSRRNARQAKAAAVAPRPVDKLRPVVRCSSIKYNRRVRAGRGFTLAELKVH